MKSYRNPKTLLLAVGACFILFLTIGFAALSGTLMINSKLSVSPDASKFKILFSSSSNVNNIVTTNLDSIVSVTGGAQATTPVINNNNSNGPTLSNLSIDFTDSGDSVTYTLYAVNTSNIKAFLTGVIFNDVDSDSVVNCVAINGTSQSAVDQICPNIRNDISIKVQVGENIYTDSQFNIINHSLDRKSSEQVIITVSYTGDALYENYDLNGDFEVRFGDIQLIYSSLDGWLPSTNDGNISTNDNPIGGYYCKVRYNGDNSRIICGENDNSVAYKTYTLINGYSDSGNGTGASTCYYAVDEWEGNLNYESAMELLPSINQRFINNGTSAIAMLPQIDFYTLNNHCTQDTSFIGYEYSCTGDFVCHEAHWLNNQYAVHAIDSDGPNTCRIGSASNIGITNLGFRHVIAISTDSIEGFDGNICQSNV